MSVKESRYSSLKRLTFKRNCSTDVESFDSTLPNLCWGKFAATKWLEQRLFSVSCAGDTYSYASGIEMQSTFTWPYKVENYRYWKFCYFGQDLDKNVRLINVFLYTQAGSLIQRCLPRFVRSKELSFGAKFIRSMITRGYLLLRHGYTVCISFGRIFNN